MQCNPKGVGGAGRFFGRALGHLGAGQAPEGAGAWGQLSAAQATRKALEKRWRASQNLRGEVSTVYLVDGGRQ